MFEDLDNLRKPFDRIVERAKLYAAGYSDVEIASRQNLSSAAIRSWRRATNRLSNRGRGAVTCPVRDACRFALYNQGLDDDEASQRLGISTNAFRKWRSNRGLLTNGVPDPNRTLSRSLAVVTPDLRRRAMSLLERGIGARLISREMNASQKTLEKWRAAMLRERPELRRGNSNGSRKTPHFPNGQAYSKMLPDRRARAFVLYADGLDDGKIAREIGVTRQKIWEWRNALFLPAIKKPRQNRTTEPRTKPSAPAITPMANPLYARIFHSIGRNIAPDLRDDAVSEMWLAIAEGRLSPDQIASQATRYRNQVVATYANRFGTRSLDEEIGDGEGFRMIDMLKDDSSSDWLEDMGATVW